MSTTPIKYSTSAALLFTEQELGGPCTEVETVYNVALSPANTIIAQGNGDRVGLVIINIGSTNITISLGGVPTASSGFVIPPSGGSITMTVRDDFTLPSRQWTAVGSGGSLVYVLEIIRYTSLELSQ